MTPIPADPAPPPDYWRAVLRATHGVLLAWAGVTLGVPWFADDLNVTIAGFPLGYWLTAQGSLLAYLALVVGYVVWMERLEDRGAGRAGDRPVDAPAGDG